ncbi:MAG: hypothetical protein LN415_06300 [Candidatus Thermoplasmatota archaeon]|nr:hypothetical protein [Candidatus Thermoplasmatota archaeon]
MSRLKNGVVIALFAAIVIVLSVLGYAVYVQLSSGEYAAQAGNLICLAVILLPSFLAFELLFKRYHYLRREPEPEEED